MKKGLALASILLTVGIMVYFKISHALLMLGLEGWTSRLPDWDPSCHTMAAVNFARAIRELNILSFFAEIGKSGLWPPAIPLIEAPFLVVLGDGFPMLRNLMPFFAIAAVIALFAAGYKADKKFGIFVGGVSAALLCVTPAFLHKSMEEMMEVPSILLMMGVLIAYFKYLDTKSLAAWKTTCFLLTTVFLAKYNYGAIFIVSVTVAQFVSEAGFRQKALDLLKKFLGDIRPQSKFGIFVILYCAAIMAIIQMGGKVEVMGYPIKVTKFFSNPLYFLIVIMLLKNALYNRPIFKYYKDAMWNSADPLFSNLCRFTVIPILVWLSYPPFFTDFFGFMINRTQRRYPLFSIETMSYYPHELLYGLTPLPLIGVLTCISVLILPLFWRQLSHKIRFVWGFSVLFLALSILHPLQEARFILPVVPFLLILFCFAVAFLAEKMLGKLRDKSFLMWPVVTPLVVLGLFLTLKPSQEDLQAHLLRRTLAPEFTDLLQSICKESENFKNNAILGASVRVSTAGIALACTRLSYKVSGNQVPKPVRSHGFHNFDDLGRIVASKKIEQFFIVDYSRFKGDSGPLQENDLYSQIGNAFDKQMDYEKKQITGDIGNGISLTLYRLKS